MFKHLIKLIKEKQRFIITTHITPDGDGLGSEIAFFHLLKSIGKEVHIINQDPLLENYSFLDPDGNITVYNRDKHHKKFSSADVLLAIDLNSANRLGIVKEELEACQMYSVCFDHHPPYKNFADIHVVNENAASIGEMVFDLAAEMGLKITKEIALGIYTSILTDTGSFRYSNTNAKTHLITAELLKHGIQPHKIYQNIYESNSYHKIALLGKMLNTMQLDETGKFAWAIITQKMLAGLNCNLDDKEGFIDILRSLKSVEVVSLFSEKNEKVIKVSIRSKGNVDVNKLASKFGGGGHPNASGITFNDHSLDSVVQKVIKEISDAIKAL